MKLEQQILNEAQGLPKQALDEILDFVQFVKKKFEGKAKTKTPANNLSAELSELDEKEWAHVEEETKNYKELYPHAK